RPAPSVSTYAGDAAGDGSPPRCLLPVAQLVESCSGAWSVPRGPVSDVGRRGFVHDALELAPGLGGWALRRRGGGRGPAEGREVGIGLDPLPEVLLRFFAIATHHPRQLEEEVAGQRVAAHRARVDREDRVELLADRRQQEERPHHSLGLAPASDVERIPNVGVLAPRRELERELAEVSAAAEGGELVVVGGRADLAGQEIDAREEGDRIARALAV